MKLLARFSLLLAMLLIVLSAYLRLHEAGIGCADWPDCYGRIAESSELPSVWLRQVQRGASVTLALVMVWLSILSIRASRHRPIVFSLLAVTLFLTFSGLQSGTLHHPAIIMGNLASGFVILGLLGWLVFRIDPGAQRYTETRIRNMRPALAVALFFLGLQITLGGLTSANFAATACPALPACNESLFPDATIYSAFRIDRAHEISANGYAIGGFERAAIHQAHRVSSLLVLLSMLVVFGIAFQSLEPLKRLANLALFLVVVEMGIGIASVMQQLPMVVALAHTWLAGLLLLALLKMLALSRERWWADELGPTINRDRGPPEY